MERSTDDLTFSTPIDFVDPIHGPSYFVQSAKFLIRYHDLGTAWGKSRHLIIARRDGKPIREWYDLQNIKNILVGPEFEGVEIYPAQSRVVDTGNIYHLWVFLEQQIPFGYVFETDFTGAKL
jgi:hypothetical protein